MPVLGPLVHQINLEKLGPSVLTTYLSIFSIFGALNLNARMGSSNYFDWEVHKIYGKKTALKPIKKTEKEKLSTLFEISSEENLLKKSFFSL